MTRRILFMLHEKRATTLLASILLGRPGIHAAPNHPQDFGEIDRPLWVRTIPAQQLLYYHHGSTISRPMEDLILGRPSISTPEAYSWVAPVQFPPDFLNSLPGDDWRFVYPFRDPRNVISSLCRRSQLEGEALNKMFETQCDYFRTEITSVSFFLKDPCFYLLQFERFILNPVDVTEEMFAHMGFKIDREFYKELTDTYAGQYINTSFGDKGKGSNRRWTDWSDDWKNLYEKSVMSVLPRLSIQEYLKW